MVITLSSSHMIFPTDMCEMPFVSQNFYLKFNHDIHELTLFQKKFGIYLFLDKKNLGFFLDQLISIRALGFAFEFSRRKVGLLCRLRFRIVV